MKTYFQNGIFSNESYILEGNTKFYIQELETSIRKYHYPGDDILYEMDLELVSLYDKFRDLLFLDTDEYYRELAIMPIFVQEAGQDAECCLSAQNFTELINNYSCKIPNLYKYLYLVDCQFLVGTIQNIIDCLEDCFCNFYINLCQIELNHNIEKDSTIWTSSYQSRNTAAMLEIYFSKAYSILDVICKIAFELENPMSDFSKYKKLKCGDVLWGDRKKLNINKTQGTLFEECKVVKQIESLRNEFVHNGTWELVPKVYVVVENKEVKERFMLYPDFEQGRLATVKNRKHFFSSGIKSNDIMPQIHSEFLQRLLNTVKLLNMTQANQLI